MGFFDAITGQSIIDSGISLYNGIANRNAAKKANEQNIALARETNALNHQMMQENNQFQLNAMREQNQFNRDSAIEMFNLENEYNNPLAQIDRLRKAGINPAVALGGSATSIVNSGDANTPSASGSGVSSSLPSLVTPQVSVVPPVSKGYMDALKTFADVALSKSQKVKTDSEKSRIDKLVDGELRHLLSSAAYSEALTKYQNLQSQLDAQFAPYERDAKIREIGAHIKQLFADASLASLKGETEKSMKLYYEAEKAVKDIQARTLREKLPFELAQLRANIRLINEKVATEKTIQDNNKSGSAYNRAMAKLYTMSADIEAAKRDWMTSRGTNEYGFPTESNLEKMFTYQMRQQVKNLGKTDKEMAKLSQEVENLFLMAKKNSKDLDWYEVDKVWKMAMEFYKHNIEAADALMPF